MKTLAEKTAIMFAAIKKSANFYGAELGKAPIPHITDIIKDQISRGIAVKVPTNSSSDIYKYNDNSCIVIGCNEISHYKTHKNCAGAKKHLDSFAYL